MQLKCENQVSFIASRMTPASTSTASSYIRQRLCKGAQVPSVPASFNILYRNASTSIPAKPSVSIAPEHGKGKGKGRVPSPTSRQLPLRKQFLLEQYRHLLSTSSVVVFFKPSDLTVAELTKLRADLSTIPLPNEKDKMPAVQAINASSATSSLSSSSSTSSSFSTTTLDQYRPRFTYLRPGLLKPTFKGLPSIPSQTILSHLEIEKGNLAVLTSPKLHPPTLKAALKAVQTLSLSPNVRKLQAAVSAAAAAAASGRGVGKGGSSTKPITPNTPNASKPEDRLPIISALVEQQVKDFSQLSTIANMLPLDKLLAQLVGLLDSPARHVIGLTQRAAGGDLVRTLDGFRVGLAEENSVKGQQAEKAA